MSQPPGLLARTLTVTFAAVGTILALVFGVLTLDLRDRIRTAETEKLRVGERMFTALEARWRAHQLTSIVTLAENPTLKAALDTYDAERQFSGGDDEHEAILQRTVAHEAGKLAAAAGTDVLAILDADGQVFASAGRLAHRWPAGLRVPVADHDQPFDDVVALPAGAFRVMAAPVTLAAAADGVRRLGTLLLATSLDPAYARELAELSRAGILMTVGRSIVGSTVRPAVAADMLESAAEPAEVRVLDREEYAVRPLLVSDDVRIVMLSSIDAAAEAATRSALRTLAAIAAGSLVLAALASLWLARTVTAPINEASRVIAAMTTRRDFGRRLEPAHSSRELDALTNAFNELMAGITAAEAETQAAYVGAIRALAAALDARDPYTAGHSERVSAISVRIARQMALGDADVEVIRLGALLHDIGKIGVRDSVLRKPAPLTADEHEQIKVHPTLGARILREVPLLAPHLPIVELHHERPDGRGYPYGLQGEAIPLAARIVHVADAFDAMTSARAYRPARPTVAAIAELRRYVGTEFDPATVEALGEALTRRPSGADDGPEVGLEWGG